MLAIRIKEKSWLAKMAAGYRKEPRIALVLGSTIYLWKVDRETFLSNPCWLRHEVMHVKQFRRYGFFYFIFLYLLENFNKGYAHNAYEQEARDKEKDIHVLDGVSFK